MIFIHETTYNCYPNFAGSNRACDGCLIYAFINYHPAYQHGDEYNT